jgi:uncharacterized membrane protein YoaK (UPF0700 family)
MSEEEVAPQVEEQVEEQQAPEPEPQPEPEAAPAPEPEAAPAQGSCGGKCNLDWDSAIKALKAPFQNVEAYQEVHDIFHWTNLINSAIAFVVVNVVATLILRYKYNLLSVVFLVAFFALLAALVFDMKRVIAYFKGEKVESQLAKFNIPEYDSYLQGFFKFMTGIVKALVALVGDVVLVRDVLLSVCFIPGCLILAFIFQRLDVAWIAYLLILFFFAWCPLYDHFPEQVDKALAAIKDAISKAVAAAKDASNKPKAE